MRSLIFIAMLVGFIFAGCEQAKKGELSTSLQKDKRKASSDESIKLSGKDEKALIDLQTASGSKITASGKVDFGLSNSSAENTDSYNSSTSDINFYEPKNAALLWLAALCLIVGVVIIVWLGKPVLGLAVAGGGVCLFGLLYYPWIAGIILAFVAIGGAVWLIYSEKSKTEQSQSVSELNTTLEIIAKAIASASDSAQVEIKSAIANVAGNLNGTTVKAVITKIKTRLGIS